ncbi:MAG: class I SAM-dependent methyltransferase [Myxococcales bacterium]|nr:class I SAM-dependent methyltransferase [Myxococcales bacterium]
MTDEHATLARYHETPGQTPAMLETWQDRQGRTTYQVLVEQTAGIDRNARILDLACGDGFLLAVLRKRGFTALEGLDSSAEELSAARARLGPEFPLHQADAIDTGLGTASFDAIVCHMALMLITPIKEVLREIARIGRPNARVLAVINRPLKDPAFDELRRHLVEVTQSSGLERLRLGDPRMMRRDELLELLSGAFEPSGSIVEDFAVRLHGPPELLWSKLRMMYDVARLPESAQEELGRRACAGWGPLANPSGNVTCAMGMRLIDARTRG